jgi:predicted MPP superfamily phosphohydrolase
MFHTMITLAYIIPNIYVFLRIWYIFINKGYKLHYTIVYILLASVYPVSNLFSEEDTGFMASLFSAAGNYILPFYLYLFLLVVVLDLILLINRLFKKVPVEVLQSIKFKKYGLAIVIFLSLLVVAGGIVNFNTIRTSEYKIEIPGKSSKINQLKIAFVADFHLQEGTNVQFVERFAEKIAAIKPDLMIFGGDIVEGDRQDENMTHFENLIKNINTRYGVYGVLGNHEYYGGEDKGSFFYKSGIKVLCDTIIVIDKSFNLGGRYDSHFDKRKSIGDFIKTATDSLPLIIVDHRPTEIDQVSRTVTDVQLSGHTHNGQLFPINLITKKINLLSWGHKKIGNTHFFVSSGIRLWGPPVRTIGKSEIMVIDIIFRSVQ